MRHIPEAGYRISREPVARNLALGELYRLQESPTKRLHDRPFYLVSQTFRVDDCPALERLHNPHDTYSPARRVNSHFSTGSDIAPLFGAARQPVTVPFRQPRLPRGPPEALGRRQQHGSQALLALVAPVGQVPQPYVKRVHAEQG